MPESTPSPHGAAGISYADEVRRKLIHLSSLWMVAAICLAPREIMAAVFGIAAVLNVLVERAYVLRLPVITPLYRIFFARTLRREPEPGQWIISGGAYVFAAAFLSTALFPRPAAAAAMAVMLLGDTAAALIGRRFGRHQTVNGKSLEGVAAFVLVGYAAVAAILALLGEPALLYGWGALGIFPAALAELFEKQLRIDDNFSIPLTMGLFLAIPIWMGWC